MSLDEEKSHFRSPSSIEEKGPISRRGQNSSLSSFTPLPALTSPRPNNGNQTLGSSNSSTLRKKMSSKSYGKETTTLLAHLDTQTQLYENLFQHIEFHRKTIQNQQQQIHIHKRLLQAQHVRIQGLEKHLLSSSPSSFERNSSPTISQGDHYFIIDSFDQIQEFNLPEFSELDLDLETIDFKLLPKTDKELMEEIRGRELKRESSSRKSFSLSPPRFSVSDEKAGRRNEDENKLLSNKRNKKVQNIVGTDFSDVKVRKNLGMEDEDIQKSKQKALEIQINYSKTKEERNIEIKRAIHEGTVGKKALDRLGHDPTKEKAMSTLGIADESIWVTEKKKNKERLLSPRDEGLSPI